jgi:colanic acid/amylovoran biosynthesis glycosyltransferase
MRIAYLVNQYPKTSHTFIRREIQALERAGLDIMRISLRGWNSELVDQEDTLEREKTRYVLRAGFPRLLWTFLKTAFARPLHFMQALSLAFRMGWRAERPLLFHMVYLIEACQIEYWLRIQDIQHLHAHFGTNSAEVAMLAHVLGGPQWSFTVHGPEEFDKPHFIGLPEKIRRSSFVVAISSFGRSQLFRLVEPTYWPKIHVVRCGLDKSFFEAASPEPKPEISRFICVGRLCEQKGQLLLLEAAARLKSNGALFELVLAGDGEMREDVEEFISKEKLGSMVRITGWINGSQIRQEIMDATALVLPSFAEGLPVVIMEAMALRRPIISTFVAGIPELVRAGEHGWLVPAGDVEALTLAMQDCLNCPNETLIEMGNFAHEKALRFHEIDKESLKIKQLFEGAIGTAVSERA